MVFVWLIVINNTLLIEICGGQLHPLNFSTDGQRNIKTKVVFVNFSTDRQRNIKTKVVFVNFIGQENYF